MPDDVQLGLFSATVPDSLHSVIDTFMKKDYNKIRVKNDMLTYKESRNTILI